MGFLYRVTGVGRPSSKSEAREKIAEYQSVIARLRTQKNSKLAIAELQGKIAELRAMLPDLPK